MATSVHPPSVDAAPQGAAATSIQLLRNVQFIYELALAQREAEALGLHVELAKGLRSFHLLDANDPTQACRRLAYFAEVQGVPTDYAQLVQYNRTRSINQYLTHWMYPYKGKFHPQMIRALLNMLELQPGMRFLDPFVGSGTSVLEAQLLGLQCMGVDSSPLCVLQSRVKTTHTGMLEPLQAAHHSVLDAATGTEDELKQMIDELDGEEVGNFFRLAVLMAISDRERRRRTFDTALAANLEKMLASVGDANDAVDALGLQLGSVDVQRGDAQALPVDSDSVDGIVTSPPYSIALDYVANDAHALSWLGHSLDEARERCIGLRGRGVERIEAYNEDLTRCIAEMARVLKPGAGCAIVIGDATYQGERVPTIAFTIARAEELGLKLHERIDKVIFGLYNVMLQEEILIFWKASR